MNSRRNSTLLLAAALLVVSQIVFATPVAAQAAADVVVVRIETAKGDITAEIYVSAAPVTSQNFLDYVDDGVFDAGTFYRSVRMDNQPNDSVRIEVVQAGTDQSMRERMRPAIPLERTTTTGLAHVDGALSMARGGPDSARSSFFICINDQPSLDFGGNRNLDGQGFAVFGRVTDGMDAVRDIQMGAVEGQQLVERVVIVRIRRVEVVSEQLAPGAGMPAP
jgi:peptidyl-prolyl cis-trans isomerase A (cyclophilin A)